MSEVELQVNNFTELLRFLNLFSILQPHCQMTVGKEGTEAFGKFSTGRCDLFTGALVVSPMSVAAETPASVTMFMSDLKKFIATLEMLNKYYDTSDGTPFLTRDIKFFAATDGSYFRISSKKYTIKFQLSSSAVNRSAIGDAKTLSSSNYGERAHRAYQEKGSFEDMNYLLSFKTGKKRIGNLTSLLALLNNSEDARIKFEIPEQVAIEQDLVESSGSMMAQPNTLYAVAADSQKLVASRLGNKVCAALGNITKLHENYKSVCRVDSLSENFVYLLTPEQLKIISSVVSSFIPGTATVKTSSRKTKKDAAAAAMEPILLPNEDEDLEIGITKVNIMHLNLVSVQPNSTTEFYVSMIGVVPPKAGPTR